MTFSATPEAIWAVIGDLSRLAAFDPSLVASESNGPARDSALRVRDRAGRTWEEQCTRRERQSGWSLVAAHGALPFPLASLQRDVTIRPSGGATDDRVTVQYAVSYSLSLGPLGALRLPRVEMSRRVRQTLEAMVHAVRAESWRHDATVQTILDRKGHDVVTLVPGTLVHDAAKALRQHRIGAALVVDDGGDLLGLVSERDITYRAARDGGVVLERPVDDIMSTDLVVCSPEHDMEFVMVCMTDRRIRHLPVVRDGALLGIISIGDVVRERIAALESQSQTMREYIQSREWNVLGEAASTDAAGTLAQP